MRKIFSSLSNRKGSMTFQVKPVSASWSKSYKEEIRKQFLSHTRNEFVLESRLQELETEIAELKNQSRSELISIQEYKDDFSKRLTIHDAEFNFAIRDLIKLGNWVKENTKSIRKEISLFPIK